MISIEQERQRSILFRAIHSAQIGLLDCETQLKRRAVSSVPGRNFDQETLQRLERRRGTWKIVISRLLAELERTEADARSAPDDEWLAEREADTVDEAD